VVAHGGPDPDHKLGFACAIHSSGRRNRTSFGLLDSTVTRRSLLELTVRGRVPIGGVLVCLASCHKPDAIVPPPPRPAGDFSRTPLEEELARISAEVASPVERGILDLKRQDVQGQGYYEAGDVINLLDEANQKLIDALQREEFQGLRRYVAMFFPKAKFETAAVRARNPALLTARNQVRELLEPTVRVALLVADAQAAQVSPTANKVTEKSGQDSLSQVVRFVTDKFSYYHSHPFQIDLTVATMPRGKHAGVTIGVVRESPTVQYSVLDQEVIVPVAPSYGKPVYKTFTDNSINGIYRGLYSYQITARNSKPIQGPLNLVDSDPWLLECILSPVRDSGPTLPCALK
jgi:hypothetical protein